MRPPVAYAQLCVIAKAVLTDDPTLDNFGWAERIKDTILRAGMSYPEQPDAIHRAMRAVETRIPRTAAPRSAVTTTRPEPRELAGGISTQPADGRTILARLLAMNPEAAATLARREFTPREPPANRTAQQIAEWRSQQQRPPYRRNAKGWIRAADDDAPHRDL